MDWSNYITELMYNMVLCHALRLFASHLSSNVFGNVSFIHRISCYHCLIRIKPNNLLGLAFRIIDINFPNLGIELFVILKLNYVCSLTPFN